MQYYLCCIRWGALYNNECIVSFQYYELSCSLFRIFRNHPCNKGRVTFRQGVQHILQTRFILVIRYCYPILWFFYIRLIHAIKNLTFHVS